MVAYRARAVLLQFGQWISAFPSASEEAGDGLNAADTPEAQLAISAERYFDDIDGQYAVTDQRGCISASGRVIRVRLTANRELMPSGSMLCAGFYRAPINGGGGLLLQDDHVRSVRAIARATSPVRHHKLFATLISDTPREATGRHCARPKLLAVTDGVWVFIRSPFMSARSPRGFHRVLISRRDKVRSGLARGAIRRRSSMVTLAPESCLRDCEDPRCERIRVAVGHSEAASRHF